MQPYFYRRGYITVSYQCFFIFFARLPLFFNSGARNPAMVKEPLPSLNPGMVKGTCPFPSLKPCHGKKGISLAVLETLPWLKDMSFAVFEPWHG